MALPDLIEPGAFEIFKHVNGKSVSGNDLHDALFTSIAISLRRMADAANRVENIQSADWPDAPSAATQFSTDTQQLTAEEVDLAHGLELARAIAMAHRSGRYHDLIAGHEDISTGACGLVAPVEFLRTLFHGRSEGEITRLLLSIPGSNMLAADIYGRNKIFVSTADLRA